MISLTEKGKVLYPQIKNIIEKTNEVMLKGINQNQQTLLNELILKMKDNLEEKNVISRKKQRWIKKSL